MEKGESGQHEGILIMRLTLGQLHDRQELENKVRNHIRKNWENKVRNHIRKNWENKVRDCIRNIIGKRMGPWTLKGDT